MKKLLRWVSALLVLVVLGFGAWFVLGRKGDQPVRADTFPSGSETISPSGSTTVLTPSESPSTLPDTGSTGPPSVDTAPGTILELGQTWRQGDVELLMTNADVYPRAIRIQFRLTNLGPTEKAIRYGLDNFSAVDNSGRRISVGGVDWNGDPSAQFDCSANTVILEPTQDDSIYIPCEFGSFEGVVMDVDVGDPTLTEIIVTVDGVSEISGARWRVSIDH